MTLATQDFRLRLVLALIGLLLLVPQVSNAQSAKPTYWDAEKVAESRSPSVGLRKQSEEVVATVPVSRVRLLVDVKHRIEKEAGLSAVLRLTDLGMPNANAFSTVTERGALVGVNIAMLELLGDDVDALAAVVGHEYAHIALDHRSARQTRETGRQVIGTLLGIILGRFGVPMGGTIADLGTSMISRTFSREEERDADEKGIRYAAAAGFSVDGGIRAWERMAQKNQDRPVSFLSTHSAPDERIESMRQLARTIPSASPQAVASTKPAGPTQDNAASASADPNSDSRWSFSGREFLKLGGITFVEEDGVLTVFDVASTEESSLRIGDVVQSCTETSVLIGSISDLLECRAANDAQTLRIELTRDHLTAVAAEIR